MTAFGEYSMDESASTVKARDCKDATDLVLGGRADATWWDGRDVAETQTTTSHNQLEPDKARLPCVIIGKDNEKGDGN